MPGIKSIFRITIWHILIACLLIAAITWGWFQQRIERIDERIEVMHKK